MRRYRAFDRAEDAVQEALVAAALQWPRDGVLDHPRGWLIQTAFRRLSDQVRSDAARRRREEELEPAEPSREDDDPLTLLFMCCHPSLTPPSAIALTLRAVGGLTTAAIARAFLVPEATMAQRISRAKATIKSSGVSFALPTVEEWPARLAAVLHVLYLIFNEGYTAQRGELADDAIRLTRTMHALRPDDGEIAGLLALLLLTDARRAARATAGGDLIPLDEQDRSRWDRAMIDEGVALVSGALARGRIGPYQLQAAIAAIHDEAAHVDDTDWPQILALYTVLENLAANPMVQLNRTVALAMVHGPRAGLERLDALARDPRLADHHRLHAVRAHLLERAGDGAAAIAAYHAAAARTDDAAEKRYLVARALRLSA